MRFIQQLFSKEENKNRKKEACVGRIDPGARAILRALEEDGFEAYVVGGCVRDLLLGETPHDWDITTVATPDEVSEVMTRRNWRVIDGKGRRFGTLIVVMNYGMYEVTTFRSEMYGEDSHRPEEVRFAHSLREDVSRRDFTVNALAVDKDGVIYDYFHGVEDLENKKLRAVGDAVERFREDALRMFRACRFLGQLDFMADKEIVAAFPKAFDRVKGLSLERIREEVGRLLLTNHSARGMDLLVRTGLNECQCMIRRNGHISYVDILPELSHLVDLPQEKEYHEFDGWYHALRTMEAVPPILVLRWAALLHDVGKGMPGVRAIRVGRYTDYGHDQVGADMAQALLSRWEMPKSFVRRVTWLIRNHMRYHYYAHVPEANVVKWLRQMARSGEFISLEDMKEAIEQLGEVCRADAIGTGKEPVQIDHQNDLRAYMLELCKEMPVTTKELHYDERTIDALGNQVGEGMKNLLHRVQNGSLENQADVLCDAAMRYRRRHEETNQ